MVEFLRKSGSLGDKIARNLRHQISQFTVILFGVEVRYDVDILKLTVSAQSIYREVYGNT